MNKIEFIREKQNQLIVTINTIFDEVVKVLEMKEEEVQFCAQYESTYPITSVSAFKGNKPIAIKIGENRIITPTWKSVVENVLEEAMKDEKMKNRIMNLRDKLLGRVRNRISSTPAGMSKPLKLYDKLYIETHYDTETLMKFLLQILNEIAYNYNNIQVIIKNKKSYN